MSNSNFNNGKRHVGDRAYYGGAPNQKKRVKPNNIKEEFTEVIYKYNLCAIAAAFMMAHHWNGDEGLIWAILITLFSGFQCFKK